MLVPHEVQGLEAQCWVRIAQPAGQVLVTKRIGIGDSPNQAITLQQYEYDILGRIIRSINALGGVSTNLYLANANGGRREVTLYPDGGTRTNDYYRDGRVQKVCGSAVAPVQYEYGLEQENGIWREYVKEMRLGTDGGTNEWTKTYQDGAGRSYKTVYAALAAPYPFSRSIYNGKGQLLSQTDPDGVTQLFVYNDLGEVAETGVDTASEMGLLDSNDYRYTGFSRSPVAAASGKPDRNQTETWVWKDYPAGEPEYRCISRTETSTSGLQTWQTIWRDVDDDSSKAVTESETAFNSSTHERTVTMTAPDGTQTVSVYLYGLLQSVTRYDAATPTRQQIARTTYGYDKYDRQTTITDARNGPTSLVLNDADLVVSTISPDPGGGPQVTSTFYDNLGRAVGTQQPDGTTTTNFYSPAGLLTNTWGSRTYPVEYTYDPQGRMLTMKTWQGFPSGDTATTRWNYDPYRGWLSSKDYPDKVTGEPPSQLGSTGPTYEYTPGGRLSTRTWRRLGTDNNTGILTTNTYGFSQTGIGHGDLVGIAYGNDPASTPSVSFTYDRQGRRSEVVRDGITTTLSYDNANEPLSESYGGGLLDDLSVSWSYNNGLKRTAVSLTGASEAYSVGYSYDDAGRLEAVNSGANGATYSYLANSPLVGQIGFTNSGTTRMTTSKQYDHVNRLTSISSALSSSSPISFAYLYNNANQRVRTTLADGSYWVYSYDALGQVTSGKRFWQDGTPVAGQQYEYAFDDIGNRKSTGVGGDAEWGPLRQASYTANRLNQYSQRDVPGAVDILGIANPTSAVTVTADNTAHTAHRKGEYFDYALPTPNDNAPWYNTVTVHSEYGASEPETGTLFVPKTPEQFTCDDDGNLTADGRWNYTWDAENRLVKVESLASAPAGSKRRLEFAYDYQGRRIASRVTNLEGATSVLASNIFLYDGWNLVAELNGTNNGVIRSYVWGLDLSGSSQGAGGVGGLLTVTYNGSVTTNCFVAYDGNGNVCGLADAVDASVVAQYEYGPFGEVIRATGPMATVNPFRFSTKYQDDETDLLYYGYRYYNGSTGRWLGRDPIEERGGRNLYAFLANAPVNSFDFLGKIARGGEMQMYCRQPCEDFRRTESEQGRNVHAGGIVCCGGVKYICTWGADNERNAKAKEIARRCLKEHERRHLPSNDCNSCSLGPVRPKWRKEGKAACEEELQAHGISKACFENALSECGGDQSCIDSLNAWIKSEETAMSYYKFMCNQPWR